MSLTIVADPVPLRMDKYGAVRIGSSQVLLDVVVREFENGATPEGIVEAYSTLQLADVYAVIAYYLRHKREVRDYLQAEDDEAGRLRREVEVSHPERVGMRARLEARRTR